MCASVARTNHRIIFVETDELAKDDPKSKVKK